MKKRAAYGIPAALAVTLAIGSTTSAVGQITFSGNFDTGNGQVVFARDFTFTLTGSINVGNTMVMVLDEPATSDGIRDRYPTEAGSPLDLTLGSTDYEVAMELTDNFTSTSGEIGVNDAFVRWTMPASLSSGTVVTVRAGTYLFDSAVVPGGSMNPGLTAAPFTGNLFLTGPTGTRISADVSAVPEPSEYAMAAGVGLVAFGVWRHRNRRAASRGRA